MGKITLAELIEQCHHNITHKHITRTYSELDELKNMGFKILRERSTFKEEEVYAIFERDDTSKKSLPDLNHVFEFPDTIAEFNFNLDKVDWCEVYEVRDDYLNSHKEAIEIGIVGKKCRILLDTFAGIELYVDTVGQFRLNYVGTNSREFGPPEIFNIGYFLLSAYESWLYDEYKCLKYTKEEAEKLTYERIVKLKEKLALHKELEHNIPIVDEFISDLTKRMNHLK